MILSFLEEAQHLKMWVQMETKDNPRWCLNKDGRCVSCLICKCLEQINMPLKIPIVHRGKGTNNLRQLVLWAQPTLVILFQLNSHRALEKSQLSGKKNKTYF